MKVYRVVEGRLLSAETFLTVRRTSTEGGRSVAHQRRMASKMLLVNWLAIIDTGSWCLVFAWLTAEAA
jgi:hypothetical protein